MSTQPKIIAFHLPQFHTFPENDEWWGEGFTEWVNVKKAQPLFPGHNQPRVPLEGYYDLSEYSTRKHQAELAKKYGIYGFCYYHYWFNGKLLMEKPLEALLLEKEINLPFCFCWANEPWTRAWDGQSSEVIMPQSYGGLDEWEEHFKYLLPFFKDNRYIKLNNAPLFVIYRTKDIPEIEQMVSYLDKRCKENGFSGIYLCEELNGNQNGSVVRQSKALIDFEPGYTQRYGKRKAIRALNKISQILSSKLLHKEYILYDYDKIWEKILDRNYNCFGKQVFMGGFVDWDNSPRRKKGAKIFRGTNIDKFAKYFKRLHELAKINQSEFIFLNAWNEWAEGTYLEPDQANGYGYLEAIKETVYFDLNET